ncbi:MAG: BON domain-containing protein [Flavobacteriales bacterium]|jgi:osmotically-inducible protein OsmY
MKSNQELQRDVQNAIRWEPLLHAAEIGVTVSDGVVSLTGIVDSYVKKMEAENAAKRVVGVKAIAEEIEVKLHNSYVKSDADIAADALAGLESNWLVPHQRIKVLVEKGWVTLEGDVPWNYQKEAANRAVIFLSGVRGVSNNLKIKSDLNDGIETERIIEAMDNSWALDECDIQVEVNNSTVVLTGTVNSWYERDEAARIAWNTPGVTEVENNLVVDYYNVLAD